MVCSENDMCGGTGWTGVWCTVRTTSVVGQVGEVCGGTGWTGVWCTVRMTCAAGQVGQYSENDMCSGTDWRGVWRDRLKRYVVCSENDMCGGTGWTGAVAAPDYRCTARLNR